MRGAGIIKTHRGMFLVSTIRGVALCVFFFIFSKASSQPLGVFVPVFIFWTVTNGYFTTLLYSLPDSLFTHPDEKTQCGLVINIMATFATYISALWNFTATPAILGN